MTFIVGGLGSGKSTIASLLLGLYAPQEGMIALDNQDLLYLSLEFTKAHIACVSQTWVVLDMSMHDAVGHEPIFFSQFEAGDEMAWACRVALIHAFVRDLPEGYHISNREANLSPETVFSHCQRQTPRSHSSYPR